MLPPVLAHMDSLGLAIFTEGDYDLNLFGIRSPDTASATFDDVIGCAYKLDDQWYVRYWAATTDPGVYYREHPLNVLGTAILIPGQYRGAYGVGLHRGQYRALVQLEPVRVYRDDDRDAILDATPGSEVSGLYGINIHASSSDPYGEDCNRDPETAEVGRWSAGCQVHATTTGFREMMTLCQKQIEVRGWTTFTYTLLDQW